MVRSLTSSTLTLSNLIGVAVADSPCLLTTEQFVQVGAALLQHRPQDPRAVCFLGGALSGLAGGRRGAPDVVSLDGDLGDDPFLVIAGQQAAVALLAVEGPDGFRARLFAAPDLVDRAALVLSQFGDVAYSLDAMCDPESQRGFVATVAAALQSDPALAGANLAGLLGDERRWLDLARAVAASGDPSALLALPEVRRLLQEAGVARAAAGLLDADAHQLNVVAVESQPAPQVFAPLPPLISGAARSQRANSATPAEASAFPGSLGGWVGGKALAVVPILAGGRALGVLLATSERPLGVAARASLNGLAALLRAPLGSAPMPASLADDLGLTGMQPALPAPRPVASGSGGLAARLSGARTAPAAPSAQGATPRVAPTAAPLPMPGAPPAARPGAGSFGPPGLPTVPAARLDNGTFAPPQGQMPPAPALAPPVAVMPAAAPQAPSLAQRALVAGRGTSGGVNLDSLIEHLSDGIVVVDSQGRLVAFTRTAMQMLTLHADSRGKSLVESGAWSLASLFTEAITGELDGPCEMELPTGRRATVDVVAMDGGNWAFVLHTDGTQPALPEEAAAARLPAVDEGERSESFLANFSNIIRVPLRELRELITQVPAMGNLNEQQSRLIGQVVRLNSEMTMLVNDLLALGQIRLQTSENRAPMRIDLLVEAAVGTQYAEFGRRGQHVVTEIASGLPRVHGSEEGLGRAVAALIDNAIKYSPAGAQIKVTVGAEGGRIVVGVQDNGPGLEAEELAQVFDPFFRAPSTEALGVSGRGLGLTIAKAVIEQHGGRIWGTGAPGQGCAFSFSIPCE